MFFSVGKLLFSYFKAAIVHVLFEYKLCILNDNI